MCSPYEHGLCKRCDRQRRSGSNPCLNNGETLENHEVAISTTGAEKRTEAQNPCISKVEERALRLDSSISLPSHQPNYCGDDNVDERVSDRGRGRGVSWLLPAMTEGAEQRCGIVLLITFNVYL